MGIEQDIKDLRDDLKTLKARVMGHELVMSTTLAQLLKVSAKTGFAIDIGAIVADITQDVEASARAIERSDPMGAASIRAVGANALRLLSPAARAKPARQAS
jgi:hypothetical protein